MSLQLGGCTEGDLCNWGDGKAYHIRDVGMLLDRRCYVIFFLMAPGCLLGDGEAVFFPTKILSFFKDFLMWTMFLSLY